MQLTCVARGLGEGVQAQVRTGGFASLGCSALAAPWLVRIFVLPEDRQEPESGGVSGLCWGKRRDD